MSLGASFQRETLIRIPRGHNDFSSESRKSAATIRRPGDNHRGRVIDRRQLLPAPRADAARYGAFAGARSASCLAAGRTTRSIGSGSRSFFTRPSTRPLVSRKITDGKVAAP